MHVTEKAKLRNSLSDREIKCKVEKKREEKVKSHNITFFLSEEISSSCIAGEGYGRREMKMT